MPERIEVWRRFAALKPDGLGTLAQTIGFDGLPDALATLLRGGARGRFVLDPRV
jgi:hypothetical protein